LRAHIPQSDDKRGFVGTARYASLNAHFGVEQSRRDDLESVAYILIYIYHGSLPWQHFPTSPDTDKFKFIREKKLNTPLNQLAENPHPAVIEFLRAIRTLQFDETPDYEHYIRLFL